MLQGYCRDVILNLEPVILGYERRSLFMFFCTFRMFENKHNLFAMNCKCCENYVPKNFFVFQYTTLSGYGLLHQNFGWKVLLLHIFFSTMHRRLECSTSPPDGQSLRESHSSVFSVGSFRCT